jgi:glucose-6-phosphate isomerase
MTQIRFDLEALGQGTDVNPAEVSADLDRFISDMNGDKSSFFNLPQTSTWSRELENLQPVLAQRIPEVDTFIHLGIGGSSLGAETILNALAGPNCPRFFFWDNIDPDWIADCLAKIQPERTLVYVVSKSGTTMETMAQFALIYQWFRSKLGSEEKAREHFVFCTDPVKGALRELARDWKVPAFEIAPNLGGRFSALSAVGLFPALVAGIDCKGLIAGAKLARDEFLEDFSRGKIHPVTALARRLLELNTTENRNITVLMPYSQKLKTLGAWFTQLWAESLGKNGRGLTPVAAVGATDQHSILQLLRDGPQDKVVGFIEVQGFQHMTDLKWNGPSLPSLVEVTGITLNQLMDAELNATRNVLTNNHRPHFTLRVPKVNASTLGQMLFALETLTGVAGYLMKIDPFDQPGVEEGKILTREYIRACKKGAIP